MAADWDLREMKMWKIIPNKDNKYSIFYFPFNAWLGPSAGKLTKESEPAKSTDLQMRGTKFVSSNTHSFIHYL